LEKPKFILEEKEIGARLSQGREAKERCLSATSEGDDDWFYKA